MKTISSEILGLKLAAESVPQTNMSSFVANKSADYVYDIKIKFEPFHLEFNMDEEIVKLPRLFNQQHFHEIAPKVFLCDPAGNMFQVAVMKGYTEAYFVQGWTQVGKFYGLEIGGWVTLVFVGWDMFLIQLRDRLDQHPVLYPLPTKIHRLGQLPTVVDYPREDNVASNYASICKKPAMFHTLDKTLTHDDVHSGFLHLPLHFCQVAFRHSGQKILIFDEYGRTTTCIVQFQGNKPYSSGVTEGWIKFCTDKAYFEGLRIQFGVPCASPTMMSVIVTHMFI